jgi:hypothetical protein
MPTPINNAEVDCLGIAALIAAHLVKGKNQ